MIRRPELASRGHCLDLVVIGPPGADPAGCWPPGDLVHLLAGAYLAGLTPDEWGTLAARL